MRILLVEDEPELGSSLVRHLQAAGFVIDLFADLASAAQAVLVTDYRAVLLDRRLPDGDGPSLIPILKTKRPSPPAIVISALDDIPDRVYGLESGAEDYLIKPFAFEELLARLRLLLRRAGTTPVDQRIRIGALEFDPATREVCISGKALPLPRRELAIVEALVRRAGRVVMRELLHDQVYGFEDDISSNALEVHISRLRRRLADNAARVEVHGIRGIGYMLSSLP